MDFPYTQKIKDKIKIPIEFERIKETNMFDFLDEIEPFGMTAMRDAVLVGISKIGKVHESIPDHLKSKYSFKIIVVTDGEDNSSSYSAPDLSRILSSVTNQYSVDHMNILFVTVDLNRHDQANLDLIGITKNSFSHCKSIEVESKNLLEVFEREIFYYEEKFEDEKKLNQDNCEVIVKETRIKSVEIQKDKLFAVLFVVDISGSMEGDRWKSLKSAVRNLKDKLSGNSENMVDLVLFSNSVVHYTHPHFKKKFVKPFFGSLCHWKPLLCCLFLGPIAPCCMSCMALQNATDTSHNLTFLCKTIFCGAIGLALNRRTLRMKYNIKGNCCVDCLIEPFCCICMTSQEWAESNYRGEGLVILN